MQSPPVTQLLVGFAALCVTASSISFAVWTWREHRNAELVQIGVSVLRVDPEKEKRISAAREWALNLIDDNAGGVKFSPEARAQLLKEPLKYSDYPDGTYGGGGYGDGTYGSVSVTDGSTGTPSRPTSRRP